MSMVFYAPISYVTRWQITLRSSRFLTSRLDCNKVLQCQSSGEEISVRMKIGTFATEDLPKSPFQDLLGSNFWAEICFRSGHPEHQIFKIFLGEDPQTPLSKSETLFENVFDMPPRSSNIQNFLGEDLQTPLKIRKVV